MLMCLTVRTAVMCNVQGRRGRAGAGHQGPALGVRRGLWGKPGLLKKKYIEDKFWGMNKI